MYVTQALVASNQHYYVCALHYANIKRGGFCREEKSLTF